MTRIDKHAEIDHECTGGCGGECDACQGHHGLSLARDVDDEPLDLDINADETGDAEEMDALTRGLLGSFARFIADDDEAEVENRDERETEASVEVEIAQEPIADHDLDEQGLFGLMPKTTAAESEDDPDSIDGALDRVEQAMAALASTIPTLEHRLCTVEERVDEACDVEWVDGGSTIEDASDRDTVAMSLKDRLASIEQECNRLASVPIERVEARVATAENTLGALIEHAESAAATFAEERASAERAAGQLAELVEALAPWVELLELRDTEDGLPKPLQGLIKIAGTQLGREIASVRENLERLSSVLEIPETTAAERVAEADITTQEIATPAVEEEFVRPESPGENGEGKPRRRKNDKRRGVKARSAEAESPRRAAGQSRLSAAARLRARSRAEGRPPRR